MRDGEDEEADVDEDEEVDDDEDDEDDEDGGVGGGTSSITHQNCYRESSLAISTRMHISF